MYGVQQFDGTLGDYWVKKAGRPQVGLGDRRKTSVSVSQSLEAKIRALMPQYRMQFSDVLEASLTEWLVKAERSKGYRCPQCGMVTHPACAHMVCVPASEKGEKDPLAEQIASAVRQIPSQFRPVLEGVRRQLEALARASEED